MARVVVTGGSGKLGDAVVADLVEHGYDVVNVDLVPAVVERTQFVRVDLTDYGQTVEVLSAIDSRYRGVDAVVHLAAIPGPGAAPNATIFANNILSTYNVFAGARAGRHPADRVGVVRDRARAAVRHAAAVHAGGRGISGPTGDRRTRSANISASRWRSRCAGRIRR